MRAQPMIAVADVQAASAWYQAVLGLASGHGGPEYEQLLSDGRLVMQIHRWDTHEHPHLGDRNSAPYGNGVVLWFEARSLDEVLARVEAAGATVLDGPLFNANAGHREIWLQDPNGYKVVIAGR